MFVIPHQFISGVCEQIKSHVTEGTIGISLIKVSPPPLPPLILLTWSSSFLLPLFLFRLLLLPLPPPLLELLPLLHHLLLPLSPPFPPQLNFIVKHPPLLLIPPPPHLELLPPGVLTLVVLHLQGIDAGPGGLRLISDIIREKMEIDVSVLMGANIANEVAAEKFCESTIGESISLLRIRATVSLLVS